MSSAKALMLGGKRPFTGSVLMDAIIFAFIFVVGLGGIVIICVR